MCAKHSDIGSVWVSTLLHKIFLGDFYLVLCAEFPWQDCWWWIELRLRVSWDHSPTTHQLQHLEQVIYPLSKLQFLRYRNDVKNPTNCSVLPRESNMLLPIQPSACFLVKCKDSIHIQ